MGYGGLRVTACAWKLETSSAEDCNLSRLGALGVRDIGPPYVDWTPEASWPRVCNWSGLCVDVASLLLSSWLCVVSELRSRAIIFAATSMPDGNGAFSDSPGAMASRVLVGGIAGTVGIIDSSSTALGSDKVPPVGIGMLSTPRCVCSVW